MKLSLKKKFGFVHVRGGDLLRASKAHAVDTGTRSALQTEYARPETDDKWVYCEEGDLALELVAVKTGKVLGHSYLSGPSIQLNRYTPAQGDWFEPAALGMAVLPQPEQDDDPEEFIPRFIRAMMDIKYGDLDVAAFRARADTTEGAQSTMEAFRRAWGYAPNVDEPPEPTAHLIGVIDVIGTKANKKGAGLILHHQPPKHAADLAASFFQCGLVLSAAEYVSRKKGK